MGEMIEIDRFYCPSIANDPSGYVTVTLDTYAGTVDSDSSGYQIPSSCLTGREYSENDVIGQWCIEVDKFTYTVYATNYNPFASVTKTAVSCASCPVDIALTSKVNETKNGAQDGKATFSFDAASSSLRNWHINSNTEYVFPTTEGVFENLAPGSYQVTLHYEDSEGVECISNTIFFQIATGEGVFSLNVDQQINTSKNGVCDGELHLSVVGTATIASVTWNGVETGSLSNTGLCAGTYVVVATDVNGVKASKTIIVTEPAATVNNQPQILYISPALSLKFVEDTELSSCNPKTLNNTLFSQFERVGGVRKCYLQKFSSCDTLPLQALSNYSSNVINVVNVKTGAIAQSISMDKVAQFSNLAETFTGFIKRHNETETRVYFNEVLIPVPVAAGDSIEIANTATANGIYQIQSIGKETNGTEYLIIKNEYIEETPTTEASVTTYFNQRNYDCWEGTLRFAFIHEGDYQVNITGSDERGSKVWISELISVKASHPGTVSMQYRNSSNKHDIYYSSGFTNYIRFEGTLIEGQSATEKELHREPTRIVTLSSDFRKKALLKTYALPPYLHERIEAALSLDNVVVEGIKFNSEEGYSREELLGRTLFANGSVLLEEEGFATFMKGTGVNVDGGGGSIKIDETGFLRY